MPRKSAPVVTVTSSDCTWQTFRAGGPGGQHQNKSETGVRCIHSPSGAVGEARDHRSQHYNRRVAFQRMANSPKSQAWVKLESLRRLAAARSIDEMMEREVERAMRPHNLRVEGRSQGGGWKEIPRECEG